MTTNSNPTVTVVIPAYGHANYISQTIDSIFSQTFTDFELIVVNDGSPDDSDAVVRTHKDFSRIRYFEQSNAGSASARNLGLAHAKGEFICFIDDDDLWPPDKLQWQVEQMRQQPDLVLLAGHACQIDSTGTPYAWDPGSHASVTFESLFVTNPIGTPGLAIIRTEALRRVGGFDMTIWGADHYDAWLRLSRVGAMTIMNRHSLFYRVHAANASKNIHRMFWGYLTVIRNQLQHADRSARHRLSVLGHRFIYYCFFRRVMGTAERGLRKGNLLPLTKVIRPMFAMMPAAIFDPLLLWWFLCDLRPRSWRA